MFGLNVITTTLIVFSTKGEYHITESLSSRVIDVQIKVNDITVFANVPSCNLIPDR